MQPGAAYRLHGHVQSGKSSLLAALGRTLLTRAQGERPDVFVHSFDPGDVHAFLRRLVELLRVGAHGADGEKAAVTAAKLLGRSGRRPWVFLVDGLDRLDPAVRTVWWKATEPLRAVSTWVIETSTPEAYPTALPLLPDGVQRLDTAAVTAILSEYLSHVTGIFVDDAAREALATAVCERSGGWPLYVRMVGEDLRNHADPAKLLRDGYLSTLPQSVEHAYEKELRDQALTDVGATAIRVLALVAAYSAPIDLASIRALFAWGDAWGDPDGYAAGLTSDRSLDGAVAILRKRLVNVTSRAGTRTLSLAEPALTSYLTTTTTLASSIHRERVLLSRAVCEEPTCPGEAPPDHTALVDWLWQRGVDVVLAVGDAHARRRCATLRSDPQYLLARAKRRHATGGGDVPAPTHTKDYGCVVRCLDDVERLTLEFPDDARLHRACAELRLVRRALSRKHGTLERTLRVAMAVCGDDEAWATTVHGLLVDGEGTPRGRQQAFVDASRLLTLHRLVNGANVSTRLVNVMERMRQDVDATLDAVGSDALQQADVWNSVGQVSHNTGDSLHGDDATPSYTFAVQCFERSLALLTQAPSSAGNPDDVRYGIFIVKYNLANALVALGDTDAARIQFTEAWRCAEENAEPHTKDAGALETWVKNWGLPILRLLKHAHKAGARLREPDSVNAAWLVRLGAPNALAATHAVGSDDPVHASLTPLYLWQAGIDS